MMDLLYPTDVSERYRNEDDRPAASFVGNEIKYVTTKRKTYK